MPISIYQHWYVNQRKCGGPDNMSANAKQCLFVETQIFVILFWQKTKRKYRKQLNFWDGTWTTLDKMIIIIIHPIWILAASVNSVDLAAK